MNKIICIVGSLNPTSKSLEFAQHLKIRFGEIDKDMEFKIIYPNNFHLFQCNGCLSCFKTGICPLDIKDDFQWFKNDILSSDLVIFISPVYSLNTTPFIKEIIDRIIYWSHYLKLARHSFISITVSLSGNPIVGNYLESVGTALGMRCLSKINLISHETYQQKNLEQLEKIVEIIGRYMLLEKKNFYSKELEVYYQMLKKHYANPNGFAYDYEKNVWDSSLGKFNSFKQFLEIEGSLQK